MPHSPGITVFMGANSLKKQGVQAFTLEKEACQLKISANS